ncbi:35166_t:CDS:2, partial [Racocetra persica]
PLAEKGQGCPNSLKLRLGHEAEKSVDRVVIGLKDAVITENHPNMYHVRSAMKLHSPHIVYAKNMQGSTEIWNTIIGKSLQKSRINSTSKPSQKTCPSLLG